MTIEESGASKILNVGSMETGRIFAVHQVDPQPLEDGKVIRRAATAPAAISARAALSRPALW
jgi:hypothetical protein